MTLGFLGLYRFCGLVHLIIQISDFRFDTICNVLNVSFNILGALRNVVGVLRNDLCVLRNVQHLLCNVFALYMEYWFHRGADKTFCLQKSRMPAGFVYLIMLIVIFLSGFSPNCKILRWVPESQKISGGRLWMQEVRPATKTLCLWERGFRTGVF